MSDDSTAEVQRLLTRARLHLDTEVAWLSRFTGDDQVIVASSGDLAALNLEVGDARRLSESICARVVNGALPPVISDARRHPVVRDLPRTREMAIGSYVGVPWRGPDGRPAGMVCCLSRHADARLDERSACERDRRTADAVLARDVGAVGPEDACGAAPLRGLLHAAVERSLTVELLALATSADSGAGRARVVGYGAFLLHGAAWTGRAPPA